MPDSTHKRLDQLMTRLLNESATADELAELEELLKSDEEARRRYVHHFDLHSELEQRAERGEFGSAADVSGTRNPTRERGAAPSSGFPRLRVGLPIAIAAAMLVVAAFVLTRPESNHIATVVSVTGPVQLTGDGGTVLTDLAPGQKINGGTFECSSLDSSAVLRFVDGSTVSIAGNTVVTVSDREQKIVRLREGSISAAVKPQPSGQPFRVFTPTAELEVKGTQFDVVASSSRTKLAVREGVVRARRMTDGESVDVPADHTTVATVEAKESFVAQATEQPITTWQADPTEDVKNGKWIPVEILERIRIGQDVEAGSVAMEDAKQVYFDRLAAIDPDYKGAVFAMPKPTKRRDDGKTPTMYLIVFDVAARQAGPVSLVKHSRIRFRGKVLKPTEVNFGFAARDPSGAGKRWLKPEQVQQVKEVFDIVIPIGDFTGRRDPGPNAVGWELTYVFCLAKDPAAKLQITSVELLDK